jgi:hypothetical protein
MRETKNPDGESRECPWALSVGVLCLTLAASGRWAHRSLSVFLIFLIFL